MTNEWGESWGVPPKQKISNDEIATPSPIRRFAAMFPPVLSISLAAKLLHVSRKTLYAWHSSGRLTAAVAKRGKHLIFWRDRLIDVIFNAPAWAPSRSPTGNNADIDTSMWEGNVQ